MGVDWEEYFGNPQSDSEWIDALEDSYPKEDENQIRYQNDWVNPDNKLSPDDLSAVMEIAAEIHKDGSLVPNEIYFPMRSLLVSVKDTVNDSPTNSDKDALLGLWDIINGLSSYDDALRRIAALDTKYGEDVEDAADMARTLRMVLADADKPMRDDMLSLIDGAFNGGAQYWMVRSLLQHIHEGAQDPNSADDDIPF